MNEQAVAPHALNQDTNPTEEIKSAEDIIAILLLMPGRGEPGRPDFPLPSKESYDKAMEGREAGRLTLFQQGVGFVALGDDAVLACEAIGWEAPEALETSLGKICAAGLSPREAAALQFLLPNNAIVSSAGDSPVPVRAAVMTATVIAGNGVPIVLPAPSVVGDDVAAGRKQAYRGVYFAVLFGDNAELARKTLGLEGEPIVPAEIYSTPIATISFGELKRLQDSLGDDRLEEVEVDADKLECITLQTGLDSVPAA